MVMSARRWMGRRISAGEKDGPGHDRFHTEPTRFVA